MTNSPATVLPPTFRESPHHADFCRMLAEHGITDTHGIELLRMVHLLANTYDNIIAERPRKEKLSAPRWRLLMRLLLEEQQGTLGVHPTQLSKSQHVSKNTISSHLRSLEEEGLIERELDPTDRRQFRIRLSDSGRALIRNATPGYMSFVNGLTAGLTALEIEQLQTLLHRLYQSLVQHGQVTDQCQA